LLSSSVIHLSRTQDTTVRHWFWGKWGIYGRDIMIINVC
jgi:hypothetical protein